MFALLKLYFFVHCVFFINFVLGRAHGTKTKEEIKWRCDSNHFLLQRWKETEIVFR